MAGVTVNVKPGSLSLTTGADGRFSADDLAPGKYTVTVSLPGYRDETAQAEASTAAPAWLDFTIRLIPGVIRGYVTDDARHRLETATVTIIPEDADKPQAGSLGPQAPSPLERTTVTDATGAYSFTDVQPGRYNLTGRIFQHKSQRILRQTVTSGGTVIANFSLARERQAPPPPAEFIEMGACDEPGEISLAGEVVLRIYAPAAGKTCKQRADAVQTRIVDTLSQGFVYPKDITVRNVRGEWAVFVKNILVITADGLSAKINYTTPKGLAENWARNLRRAIPASTPLKPGVSK